MSLIEDIAKTVTPLAWLVSGEASIRFQADAKISELKRNMNKELEAAKTQAEKQQVIDKYTEQASDLVRANSALNNAYNSYVNSHSVIGGVMGGLGGTNNSGGLLLVVGVVLLALFGIAIIKR